MQQAENRILERTHPPSRQSKGKAASPAPPLQASGISQPMTAGRAGNVPGRFRQSHRVTLKQSYLEVEMKPSQDVVMTASTTSLFVSIGTADTTLVEHTFYRAYQTPRKRGSTPGSCRIAPSGGRLSQTTLRSVSPWTADTVNMERAQHRTKIHKPISVSSAPEHPQESIGIRILLVPSTPLESGTSAMGFHLSL